MLPTPEKFFLTAAAAEGHDHLTAFDKALLEAGIGNINLIKVSSILPPSAKYTPDLVISPGSLVPTAYGHIVSEVPGELISASVGVGFSTDSFGVIMEFSGKCTKEEANSQVEYMLRESFANREMELIDMKIKGIDHKVEHIGCALAAVPLWY
ncbi:MAG: arginine decarboxylase, pyruvoyl-dependent [Clostridiales bacterium]|nr:arginine decarboxylase, pyruvoyl-dependent [Clostridiales bacterium]MCF8021406.1 arginine decarboxylase, pyruvoyl-dependent [Clostridiales bacterium]